jgi:hypothetical protein
VALAVFASASRMVWKASRPNMLSGVSQHGSLAVYDLETKAALGGFTINRWAYR